MEKLEKCILIIEDDEGLQSQLKWHFDDFESTIVTASNVSEAITAVRHYQPSIIIQDLGLPPDAEGVSEGFRCIEEIIQIAPRSKIIVLTGKNDHQNALRAISTGAFDFYFKPVETDRLDLVVEQAFKLAQLEHENAQNQTAITAHIPGVITANSKMKNICRMVEKIGQSDVTATLIGESGTGKEVLARAIHRFSKHPESPFVAINCAAVPENLMESELFGYEKGAFTGATARTIGKIERANNGTLFLDEIGDMPLNLQAKLLRFLQERKIERVGGHQEIAVDLRVVCATNKDLRTMVQEGTFREDLFYRICEIVVDIPPLRERRGDAVLIAKHFLAKQAEKQNQKPMQLAEDAIAAIEAHHWPGNVREVENRMKRAMVMADKDRIHSIDLDIQPEKKQPSMINLKEARRSAEVEAIFSALELCEQNVSAAAKMLGITRPTLYDMMKKYNLAPEAGK